MGTTLTSLQAGSTNYCYVVAIEGYSRLLTNAPTVQSCIDSWAGTDWTAALDGLFVEAQHDQHINPWEPFNSGGNCVITVAQDAADTFGIDTHRKGGSDETLLTVELDRNDTTVTVKSASLFDASGEIHIGTECIAYTGKTATTFTTCTRGKYSPFPADGSEPSRFSNNHRVGFDDQSTKLQPVVSSIPRAWAGRRIGVWVHRVVAGVLDVKAQAHLVYAGRIVDIRDDPGGISTVVECEHILDEVKEGTIGGDLWGAKLKAGVYLDSTMSFSMSDFAVTSKTATTLEVVPSGATGANQIDAGFYTHSEIFSKLEVWWVSELAATRLHGTYRTSISAINKDEVRTKLFATIPVGFAALTSFTFTMPEVVAAFLGWTDAPANSASGSFALFEDQPSDLEASHFADFPPLRAVMLNGQYYGPAAGGTFNLNRVEYYDDRGHYFDNFNYWPGTKPAATTSLDGWGIFLIDGKILAMGLKDESVNSIGAILPISFQYSGASADIRPVSATAYDSSKADYIDIKQVAIFEAPLYALIARIFYSTGTTGYNHDDYDDFPATLGLGIPADLQLDRCSRRRAGQHLGAARR